MSFRIKLDMNFSFQDDIKRLDAISDRIVREALDIVHEEAQNAVPDGSGAGPDNWPGDYAEGWLRNTFTLIGPYKRGNDVHGIFRLGPEAGRAYYYGHAHEHGETINAPMFIQFNDGEAFWVYEVEIRAKNWFHGNALPRAEIRVDNNIRRIVQETKV